MAFTKKFGNLFKQAISSNPSIYQAIRCMSSSKLYVGGLSYSVDDQNLREAFTNYGHVIEARVIVDYQTGRSRGFGFVTFTSSDEASNAINVMNGKDLHGRLIRVNYATDRARGGGGYVGGGSYGGDSGGWTGSYGGSSGGGYSAAGARGGYGSSGATGGYGGGGASGGYGGDSYGAGGSGGFGGSSDSYGSGSSAGNYGVAGGSYGNESFGSGAARSEGFASTGSAGICGGSGAAGYGSSGADQYGSGKDSAGASHGSRDFSSQQDDSFEGNHVDDDDEPNKYVDKQS